MQTIIELLNYKQLIASTLDHDLMVKYKSRENPFIDYSNSLSGDTSFPYFQACELNKVFLKSGRNTISLMHFNDVQRNCELRTKKARQRV